MDDLSAAEIIMSVDSDMTDSEFDDALDLGNDTDEDDESSDDDSTSQPPTGQQNVWLPATRQPPFNTFLGSQGPTNVVDVNNEESPLDYFRLIFTDELLEKVVEETNRYASQYLSANPLSPSARAKLWKNVDKDELMVFLGLVMLTGIFQKKGRFDSYWSKNKLICTPFFNECMPRNRFQIITSFLHFNDNARLPENTEDKLYKVRPVYDVIVNRWRDLYNLGEHISIDEGMLKWRGRLGFRVYNKDKPIKYGIKSYILADSSSHYCWNLSMYHRVQNTLKETVATLLTPKCHFLWHSLYMDNYYNSVAMSELLLTFNIHTVGTLRSNRGEPKEIRAPARLGRGDVIARDNGKVVVLAWKDKRIVKAISTKHDAAVSTVTRRKPRGGGEMEEIEKPNCIVDYNKHMSGVDLLDQMIAYYPCTRRTLKWTKKVFFYLMEISVHNSFILYKEKSTTKSFKTLYKFSMELISQLCLRPNEQSSDDDDAGAPPSKAPRCDPEDRLRGGFKRHEIALFPATEKKKCPQRGCRVCLKHGNRKDTRYYCLHCGVPLCIIPCFKLYHSVANY